MIWLAIIFVLVSSYFMGNWLLDTYKENIRERMLSSIFGVSIWATIVFLAMFLYSLYLVISYIS